MPQISPPLALLLLFSTLNPSVQYQANPISSPSLPFLSRSSLRSRNLKQCPKECDAIPVQSDLPYCGSVIGYSVCQTQDTWIGQDALFPSFIDKLGINLDDLSAAADGSNEDRFTYDCANAIIQLECKNLFPACEIGVEVRRHEEQSDDSEERSDDDGRNSPTPLASVLISMPLSMPLSPLRNSNSLTTILIQLATLVAGSTSLREGVRADDRALPGHGVRLEDGHLRGVGLERFAHLCGSWI